MYLQLKEWHIFPFLIKEIIFSKLRTMLVVTYPEYMTHVLRELNTSWKNEIGMNATKTNENWNLKQPTEMKRRFLYHIRISKLD